jgi:hypothetical protein
MEARWVREINLGETPESPCCTNNNKENNHIHFTYLNQLNPGKNQKLKEQLEIITDEIITICYQIEKEVLTKGYISDELLTRFEALNELNSFYKKALGYESPYIVDFPNELIIEYEILKEKSEKLIDNTKKQIEIIGGVEGSEVLVEILNYRLNSLFILCLHYQRILTVSNKCFNQNREEIIS